MVSEGEPARPSADPQPLRRPIPTSYSVPVPGLLDAGLSRRAAPRSSGWTRRWGQARAGTEARRYRREGDGSRPRIDNLTGTSHVYQSVDRDGKSRSLTTTIESAFAARGWMTAGGFLLNNEADRLLLPPGGRRAGGRETASRAGKRPRSSMAPTRRARPIFGRLYVVVASPGVQPRITGLLGEVARGGTTTGSSTRRRRAALPPNFPLAQRPEPSLEEGNGRLPTGGGRARAARGHEVGLRRRRTFRAVHGPICRPPIRRPARRRRPPPRGVGRGGLIAGTGWGDRRRNPSGVPRARSHDWPRAPPGRRAPPLSQSRTSSPIHPVLDPLQTGACIVLFAGRRGRT